MSTQRPHQEEPSRLHQLVTALETLDAAEYYLYGTTYAQCPLGLTWGQWFENVNAAVAVLRTAQLEIRKAIAGHIGARIIGASMRNCECCHEPISSARLVALPQATHCVDCARERERLKATL